MEPVTATVSRASRGGLVASLLRGSHYLRYLRSLLGVGVRSAMQLAMNASHAPHRDPRGHIVSVAYAAQLPRVALPKAGSDAMHAEWLDTREVTLGFDHACILADAKAKKTGFSQR